MQTRSLMMAGAMTGLALSMAGQASAQSASEQIRAQQAQIEEMKRQIQAMEQKLQQLQAATQQNAQQTAAVAAKAEAVAKPGPKVVETAQHKLAIESADGQYSVALTGRIHLDAGDYFSYQPQSKGTSPQDLNSGFNARRARIGVTGKVAGDWTYGFIYDGGNSADNTPAGIQTAQVGYTGLKNAVLELGYSDTFFTLDEATSSNDIMFMERASPGVVATNINAGDFRSNAGARYFTDRFWLGAYFTGPKNGDAHGQGESIGAFQRATVQLLQDENYSLHLGVGVDEIIKAPYNNATTTGTVLNDTFALSDRPELRIDSATLLNTGQLGTAANPVSGGYVVDVEAAAGYGSLYAQGEYLHFNIDRTALATAEFDGGYGEASWTLTGESRKYNKAFGAYSGIIPAQPFSLEDGTWGALEVAARYSYIDLVDHFVAGQAISLQPDAINGGKQSDFTFGLNWYPNSYMRFMLNYVHMDFDKAASSKGAGLLAGAPVGATSDAIAIRSQVAW